MGIFRRNLTRPGRTSRPVWDDMPGESVGLWVWCDRCHVAEAHVEVLTDAGPVFLCQHHFKEHRDVIVAVGHPTRTLAARQ
jgi:hypothetical protein